MLNHHQSVSNCIRYSKRVALFTFLIGTLLMLWYYFNSNGAVIYLSLFYIISMLFLNLYFAVVLFHLFLSRKLKLKLLLQTWGILLLNIPVGYLYVQLGLEIYQNATPVH